MIVGLALSIVIIFTGSICDIFHLENISNKLSIAFKTLLVPTLFLIISIARLAKYHFFSSKDINCSGLTNGSQNAKVLKALIQNTLEQLCIVFIAYTSWAV